MSCSSDKRPQWHGTTNVAFASRDGIVMTADRKSTSVITLVAKEKCKIFKAGRIGITVSGNATDSQELVQVLTKMVEADQVCMFDEKVRRVFFGDYTIGHARTTCATIIVLCYLLGTTWLKESYYVDVTKIRVRDKNELEYWAGSGGVFAYQYLAGRDLANMSNPEAINVGMGAVDFAIMHDPYSGFGTPASWKGTLGGSYSSSFKEEARRRYQRWMQEKLEEEAKSGRHVQSVLTEREMNIGGATKGGGRTMQSQVENNAIYKVEIKNKYNHVAESEQTSLSTSWPIPGQRYQGQI
ncbi:hypothetical protein C5167_022074 [Papaver somniferum]|uniref:Uncharacterized protein n=1 Tax=Papaver somniferum TaxID=3469 RepID=A0A4Y7JGV0_PAPSO|nr:hypothetical protein C5167_022074 [Papaver somniferum]